MSNTDDPVTPDKDGIKPPIFPIRERNPYSGVVVNFAYIPKTGKKLPLDNLDFDICHSGSSLAQYTFDNLTHAFRYIELAQKQYPRRKLSILILT